MKNVQVGPGIRFGPIREDFSLSIGDGYSVLVGPNNAGKSAVLQLAFRHATDQLGIGDVVLIRSDRAHILGTTQIGNATLEAFNTDQRNQSPGESTFRYEGLGGAPNANLSALLLNHSDFLRQTTDLNDLLEQLQLPRILLKSSQEIHFADVQAFFQGSGLRALMPILCALTDPKLQLIIIDEPEISLHASLQRELALLLRKHATGRGVLVATHSHLFLNRQEPLRNFSVAKDGGGVQVGRVTSVRDLMDVTFQMLGNSTADLFLPSNFLIVEGPSDQVILEHAIALLKPDHGVKVLAAGGIHKVQSAYEAVDRSLLPLVPHDSPYAKRVVAMVDAPNDESATRHVNELRRVLGERLIELPERSIEATLPEDLFSRAGLDKTEVLARIEQLHGKREDLDKFKREVNQRVAEQLELDDLEAIPALKTVATLALAIA